MSDNRVRRVLVWNNREFEEGAKLEVTAQGTLSVSGLGAALVYGSNPEAVMPLINASGRTVPGPQIKIVDPRDPTEPHPDTVRLEELQEAIRDEILRATNNGMLTVSGFKNWASDHGVVV